MRHFVYNILISKTLLPSLREGQRILFLAKKAKNNLEIKEINNAKLQVFCGIFFRVVVEIKYLCACVDISMETSYHFAEMKCTATQNRLTFFQNSSLCVLAVNDLNN